MELSDTTCPNCGRDCVIDREWASRYPESGGRPASDHIWVCTECGGRYTNTTMVTLQEDRKKQAEESPGGAG